MNEKDLSFVPQFLSHNREKQLLAPLLLFLGVLLVSLLAQVSIYLPWTPVPITGQTFGVALISLFYGRKLAPLIVVSYLVVGFLGFPVFAKGTSGLTLGPTFGYLIGMLISSYVVGSLADLGWTKSFLKTYFATVIGSAIVFFSGALWLAQFVPFEKLLWAGIIPFLPGDFIKSLLATSLATSSYKALDKKR